MTVPARPLEPVCSGESEPVSPAPLSLAVPPDATHEQAAKIVKARRALVAAILGPAQPERTQHETNACSASAQRDLTALADVLPVLLGRASPIVRLPGGTPEGSPAELVQPLLAAAVRGLYRLAWLREHRPVDALVLTIWWLLLGDEARVGVPELLVDLVDGRAPVRGPRAAKLDARAEGLSIVAAAEAAYSRAPELACDARWLSGALEDAGRALGAVRAARLSHKGRRSTQAPVARHPRVAAVCASGSERCLDWAGSCEAQRGFTFGRKYPARCSGRKGRRRCLGAGRWTVRQGALVVSERADRPFRATRESKTWGLLLAVTKGAE